jgi:hypothetical protein
MRDQIVFWSEAHLLSDRKTRRSSAAWWRRHWEGTGIVDVDLADSMPDGWKLWLEWLKNIAPENQLEIQSLEADGGRHLTYNRAVCRRRQHARLDEPLLSIPTNYSRRPLLRSHS